MLKIESGKFEVTLHDPRLGGLCYFERMADGAGGNLYFEGVELVDYDGFFELPKDVISALRCLNYKVNKEYFE